MIDKDRTNDVMFGFVDTGQVATCFWASSMKTFSYQANLGERRRMPEYSYQSGPYIADNRARVVRDMLEHTDKQWLWMLDTDIQFPANSLSRLLAAAEEHECFILAGAYWNQYPGSQRYLSWLNFTPKGMYAVPELPEDRETPVAVTAAGMGCTLIHRDALEAVTADYPNDPWDSFGQDVLVQFSDGGFLVGRSPDDFDREMLASRPIDGIQRMGEDVTFCLRAQKAGFAVFGLPSLVVEHYKASFLPHGRLEAPKAFGNGGVGSDHPLPFAHASDHHRE